MTLKEISQLIDTSFLYYFTSVNIVYLLVMFLGSWKICRRKLDIYFEHLYLTSSSLSLPEISFLVPAYNEENKLLLCIENLKNLTYPSKQVIIVNDGSKDKTLSILKKELDLYAVPQFYDSTIKSAPIKQVYLSRKIPYFMVIDKENGGGKFDALNAGINACKNNLFVTLDADTFIDDKTFTSFIRPLLSNIDIIAVGATIKIGNSCRMNKSILETSKFPQSILPLVQSIEYTRSFLERQGWDHMGGNFVLSGAFNIIKRDVVIEAGGYVNTVAEDMEIIIRLTRLMKEKKKKSKILYLPDPVAWTMGPTTHYDLAKQRAKWHRGLLDCLWFHKKTFLNVKYGLFGIFIYPFWIWGEAIEPVVEALGMLYIIIGLFFGFVNHTFIFLFIIITWGFTTVFTAHCLMMEEFFFRRYTSLRTLAFLIVYNALENLGYRQMNVLFRLWGCVQFLFSFSAVKKTTRYVGLLMKQKRGVV